MLERQKAYAARKLKITEKNAETRENIIELEMYFINGN